MVIAQNQDRCPSCGAAVGDSDECAGCGPTAVRAGAAPNKTSLLSRLFARGAPIPPPPTDSLIGREIIGQFVVRQRLGQGGMGAVYLADQPSVGRRAVIKVLHAHLSADQDLVRRFHIEARAASAISHPNIVTIYNHGVLEDGVLFLAMEYLEGTDLHAALEANTALAPERALGIILQLTDALGEAHRRGLVHRDLKPSNIMLISRGEQQDIAKILDFGIAKVEGVDLTATGLVCGTPRYMSPEQFLGKAIDGRSDLYSLGVVLYEMLVGRAPFEADSMIGYMREHVHAPPPPPSLIAPRRKLAPYLEQLLLELLSKDPGDRPQTAEAVSRRIREAMRERDAVSGIEPLPSPPRALVAPGNRKRLRQNSASPPSSPWLSKFSAALARWVHHRWPWRRRTRTESVRAWLGALFRRRSRPGLLARIGAARLWRTK